MKEDNKNGIRQAAKLKAESESSKETLEQTIQRWRSLAKTDQGFAASLYAHSTEAHDRGAISDERHAEVLGNIAEARAAAYEVGARVLEALCRGQW